MKPKSKITLTALLILFVALTRAMAQFTYNAVDLGTLGGPTSTATAIDPSGQVGGFSLAADGAGHAFFYTNGTMSDLGTLGGAGMIDPTSGNPNGALGSNGRGEIVGFSATDDGSIHALLFTNGQMIDLNTISDLSAGGFKVLTVAKAINDSDLIVGDGIMTTGDRHAFLLVPVSGAASAQGGPAVIPTKGGQWSYANDQWVWAASDGGWGYSGGGWQWNGPGNPPHHHPHTPPPPPPVSKTPIFTPIINKTPILAPIYGKTPVISHLPPPAPPPPTLVGKAPLFATPVISHLPPPAPPPPTLVGKAPLFATPVISHLTPAAPSPAPSPVPSPGRNKPPIGGAPPPSALPSPTPAPSPSATPRHHRPPTKTGTPAPSPSATPRHHRPPTKTASPTPSPKPTPREQHHHNPH